MIFGVDFFKILQFTLALLKLIADCFGDDDSQARATHVIDQHKDDVA